MTHEKYTVAMQQLYEHEVMTFLDSLLDTMVRRHTLLTQSDKHLEQVRQIWKKRLDYVWIKFLLNEQELKDTDG